MASHKEENHPLILMRFIPIVLMMMMMMMMMMMIDVIYAQMNGFPPTVFLQQPQSGNVELPGNSKVLLCSANGSPNPVYQWTKNGISFLQNSSDTALKLQSIQVSDSGLYQCIASNSFGSLMSSSVPIQVAYMVPYNNTTGVNVIVVVTANEGQAAILTLPPIDSVPPATIQWSEGGSALTTGETQRYQVTLNNRLVLLETRATADNGSVLVAVATNSYTQQMSDSPTYLLNVVSVGSTTTNILPQIVVPPFATTAVQGDDQFVKLECVANARPLNYLSLNWYRRFNNGTNRQTIQPDSNKYLLSTYRRVLTIRNPVTGDSGIYQCEAAFVQPGAINQTQTVVAEANLTVFVKPNFLVLPPSDVDADVGATVTMSCQTYGIPTPTVQWYKDSQMINNTMATGQYQLLSNGSIGIQNAMTTDSGVFQCFVTNNASQINAATWLNVLSSAPEIVTAPQNQSVIEGNSVTFTCVASGAPKPLISWSKIISGVWNSLTTTSHFQVLDGQLLIPVSQVNDAGVYACNASNEIGWTSSEAFLSVTVRTQIVQPPQNLSIIKSSTAMFQCGVKKDPLVTVSWHWFFAGVEMTSITEDGRQTIMTNGSLTIISVRNTDIGLYTCLVVSVGGNDSASASLTVLELPYQPEIISVQLDPNSKTSVDILWIPNFDGLSPIKYFILRYAIVTLLNAGVWQIANNSIPPNQYNVILNNLKPSQSYQFTISAVNDVGEGPQSNPSSTITLPQQPPSGPPLSVTGSPRSNSSILLQWQSPDPDLLNGALLGYIVRYKPFGYPDSTLAFENITTNQISIIYVLNGLIVFQEYDISVAAFNAMGIGIYSNSVYVRTNEGVPTAPPTQLTAVAINSTALNVSWLPPNPQYINGINQGYKIYAQEVNTTTLSKLMIIVQSNPLQMLGQQTTSLSNLRKFTFYSVTIVCFTSQGDGNPSRSLLVQTLEDVPDQIASLMLINVTDKSLVVVWLPPINVNGILTNYSLTWTQKGFQNTTITATVNSSVLNYTITGLIPTTNYTIAIWANTRVGPGSARSVDITSGRTPILPLPPTNLAVTSIKDRSVLLQFIPGFSGYTSIFLWIIQSQTILSNTWTTVFTTSQPDSTALTVVGLSPFTHYRLRLIAENVAGQSNASDPSGWFDTLEAVPSFAPTDVSVGTINETSLRVSWSPLSSDEWNGLNVGYNVQWKMYTDQNYSQSATIFDANANSYQINGLRKWTLYDVEVSAFNNIGTSEFSETVLGRTLESTPSSGPSNVIAFVLSSTMIEVSWLNVSQDDQNGIILGYKVLYYPSNDTSRQMTQIINDSSVMSFNITHLYKFVWYSIQVLAYTIIGDGVPSYPPVLALTLEDVPGQPCGVYFPVVTETTLTVVWGTPCHPNGIITGYAVAYGVQSNPQNYTFMNNQLGPNIFSYFVANLNPLTYYMFMVTAKTRVGWGESAQLAVYTISARSVPQAPNKPFIVQVGDRWAMINWTPRGDGYGPIRNYSLEVQLNGGSFVDVDDYIPANATDYMVKDLTPNSLYSFRIAAWNDVGRSDYSNSSDQIETDHSAPDGVPTITSLLCLSPTSMHVSWQAPPKSTWNGDLLGYDVAYRQGNSQMDWYVQTIDNTNQNYAVLNNVELFTVYEVKIRCFNEKGDGSFSSVVTVYLELSPTATVLNVEILNVSSTSALVAWQPPPMSQWNGNVLGYKIFYWMTTTASLESNTSTILVVIVHAPDTQVLLVGLQPYTQYTLTLLAFNMAGDGPNITEPINVTTNEDIPGPPGPLSFVVPYPGCLNVSWNAPLQPNGIIIMYEVFYFQDFEVNGISKSIQVLLTPDKTSYYTQQLVEDMSYLFSVKAKTSVGWGQASLSNVTIGPQPGSPRPPTKPICTVGTNAIGLSWTYGDSGESPIVGCIVEGQQKSQSTWQPMITLNVPNTIASISFISIQPQTNYRFVVIAINAVGIGEPSEASDYVTSGGLSTNAPFYQQWWFLVIVALVGFIFIILVTSCLCITGKRRYDHKQKKNLNKKSKSGNNNSMVSRQTTLQMNRDQMNRRSSPFPTNERTNQNINNDNEELEEDFSLYELNQHRRNSQRTMMTRLPSTTRSTTNVSLSSSSRRLPHLPPLSHPPLPNPGRVNYNFDDKTSPDSSSLSEKTSDVSTIRSDSDDDVNKASSMTPTTFVNHYVRGNVKDSVDRNKSVFSPYNYSYVDSEQESSHYAGSLNGAQIVINNTAGSRAPLPGFSSFV